MIEPAPARTEEQETTDSVQSETGEIATPPHPEITPAPPEAVSVAEDEHEIHETTDENTSVEAETESGQTAPFDPIPPGEPLVDDPKPDAPPPEATTTPDPVPTQQESQEAEQGDPTPRTPRILYGSDRPKRLDRLERRKVAPREIQERAREAREALRMRTRTRLNRIVAQVAQKGSITNDGVEKLLRVSDTTATRYLNELVRTGRLAVNGRKGKALRYLLPG